jgi:sodium/bile acid cotransporter 7
VGQLVQNLFPTFTKRVIIGWKLSKLSSIALLAVVWQAYDGAFSTGAFTSVKGSNIIFIVFISIALFGLFNCIAFLSSIIWLSKEDTIAVCYCAPAKSVAILVPVSLTLFKGLDPVLQSKLQVPIVIYQGLQVVGGSLLIHPFRHWIEKDARSSNSTELELETGAT